jgi:LCP family protein required for cell wall assembly
MMKLLLRLKSLINQQPLSIVVILLVVVVLAACSGAAGAVLSGALPSTGPLVTADPFATSTPTPFIPLHPTATPTPGPTSTPTPLPTPTSIYVWGSFPAPVEPSAIEIPTPKPRIDFPEDVVNIILLGSDLRKSGGSFRTDTIMILSLDPGAGKAILISIPRDLYVYLPGWRVDRINTADVRGGPEMVRNTVLYNLGIEIDYFVRVNFYGFINAIDLLGGIYVPVEGYLQDQCGDTWYSYSPGLYHMDGYTALCYVRMRKRSSDFDRLRRQQEVIQAVFNRLLSLDGLARVPQLYNQFSSLAQTDISLNDILPLIPLGAKLASDASLIQSYRIDSSMVTSWRVPYSGASVQLPNDEAIEAMLQSAFGP